MVYSVRVQCGIELAAESYVDADIVSSVPESGTAAALGFSQEVSESIYAPISKAIILILQNKTNTENISLIILCKIPKLCMYGLHR